MKKINWATMIEKGQVAALEEFFVRVDELNEHALSLTRQTVALRLLDLTEDLFAAFGDGNETPQTLRIRASLGGNSSVPELPSAEEARTS